MSEQTEIERTFLANYLPKEIENIVPVRMRDTYIPENASHPHLRLRQKGANFEVTKKVSIAESDASMHVEHIIVLSQQEYEALQSSSRRIVEKDRYSFTHDGITVEVDVFVGNFQGLVLVDFEFADEEAMRGFEPPEYCLCDVTQDEEIAGAVLAGKTYADIADWLAAKGYVKIV